MGDTPAWPIRIPYEVEAAACEAMRRWGFVDAFVAGGGGPDVGKDVDASQAIAQVKAELRPVGRPVVQQTYGVAASEGKIPIVFALGGFTDEAIDWANQASVALFVFDAEGQPDPLNRYALDQTMRSVADFGIAERVDVPNHTGKGTRRVTRIKWIGDAEFAGPVIDSLLEYRKDLGRAWTTRDDNWRIPPILIPDVLVFGSPRSANTLAGALVNRVTDDWRRAMVQGDLDAPQRAEDYLWRREVSAKDLAGPESLFEALGGDDQSRLLIVQDLHELPTEFEDEFRMIIREYGSRFESIDEPEGLGELGEGPTWLWPYFLLIASTSQPEKLSRQIRDEFETWVVVPS